MALPAPLLVVRHAAAIVSDASPPAAWPLSEQGRLEARALGQRLATRFCDALAVIRSSSERKAIDTAAAATGVLPVVDDRLGEVQKPWYDRPEDHKAAAIRYLSGSTDVGWEPRGDAISRFDAAVADLVDRPAAVSTHGTVLSLWLTTRLDDFDPVAFWQDLRFPDAHVLEFDSERGGRWTMERV